MLAWSSMIAKPSMDRLLLGWDKIIGHVLLNEAALNLKTEIGATPSWDNLSGDTGIDANGGLSNSVGCSLKDLICDDCRWSFLCVLSGALVNVTKPESLLIAPRL